MNRLDLLLFEWRNCYDKEDWYPPLSEALKGVTLDQANWRPEGAAANSISGIVNHLLYYKERLLKRMQSGDPSETADDNDATFVGTSNDKAAWQATLARLDAVHHEIGDMLEGYEDKDLDRTIPIDKKLGLALASIIMHDAYHTGQIVQIRKLQGSWPARS